MSHLYCTFTNNDPKQEMLANVGLSNTSHETWQEIAGLHRDMKNLETNEVEQWPFHTTIYDAEPLSLDPGEFDGFVDVYRESGRAEEHTLLLLDLISAQANDRLDIEYRVFIY